jgi:hypothetical protein
MTKRSARSVLAAAALVAGPVIDARAQGFDFETQRKVVDYARETAQSLCDAVRAEGSSRAANLNGKVEVEVNGLLRRLAELGLSVGGSINSTQYRGLRQEDLPAAMRDASNCRQRTFDSLVRTLMPQQGPGRPPAPRQDGVPMFEPTAALGQPGWSRDPNTQCRFWNDAPQADETVHWIGDCRNGVAHGIGTFERRTPMLVQRILGEMSAGRMTPGGFGSLNLPTVGGQRLLISGAFQPGTLTFSGPVKMTGTNMVYEGELDERFRAHGFGTFTFDGVHQITALWTHGCGIVNGSVFRTSSDLAGCPYQ